MTWITSVSAAAATDVISFPPVVEEVLRFLVLVGGVGTDLGMRGSLDLCGGMKGTKNGVKV